MGIGIWELVLLFLIVLVLFGTKKLRNIGGDLGSAIRSFRSAMNEGDDDAASKKKRSLEDDGDSAAKSQREENHSS